VTRSVVLVLGDARLRWLALPGTALIVAAAAAVLLSAAALA
jgi:hypothetical protein